MTNYLVKDALFGRQLIDCLDYNLLTALDLARNKQLEVAVSILQENEGKSGEEVMRKIVEKGLLRDQYTLLKARG